MRSFWRRLMFRLHNSQFEQDLAEEMQLHLALRAEESEARGTNPEEAAFNARRNFGNPIQLREQSREAWGWAWLDSLRQDLRYGVRSLAASPAFTATAILSLGLGIGANTAIFSILNAVLLRSLPVNDPHQLVTLQGDPSSETVDNSYTYPIWDQLRSRQRVFSGTLAYARDRFDLSLSGESHFIQGLWVSGEYFRVLGIPAIRGRVLTADDDLPGRAPVAVISYRFWKRNFAGDPAVLGRTVRLDRHPFEIVGIAPEWFNGLDADQTFDIVIPLAAEPLMRPGHSLLDNRSYWWLRILGRLAPGVTLQQANVQIKLIAPQIFAATLDPTSDDRRRSEYLKNPLFLRPVSTGFSETGTHYRTALYALMGIVALVLLIACANIANLLLARGAARAAEFSIRMAIGAGRPRIVRQLMTESLLLSLSGAAAGLLLAQWGSRILVNLLSTTDQPVAIDVSPDSGLLLFTIGISVATAFLFGLAPAVSATRVEVNRTLKENARTFLHAVSSKNWGRLLVAGQIALSLVLLVGAALFLGTLRNLLTVDAGFSKHNILLARVDLMQSSASPEQRRQTYRDMLQSLRNIPGVVSAASSAIVPVSGRGWTDTVQVKGYAPKSFMESVVWFNRVAPDFFRTLRTPVVLGRDFKDTDGPGSPKVIIINETMSRKFFGTGNPLGKTVGLDREGQQAQKDFYQVIGIVRDAKYRDIKEEPQGIAYLAFSQDPKPDVNLNFEVRSDLPVNSLVPPVRAALIAADPHASLEFRNLETQIAESLVQQRVVALLSSSFGAVALLLAMVGLYGVTTYSVTRRQGEIGIRMALGASSNSVLWLILRGVGTLLAIGISLGLVIAIALGRLISSLLYGVKPSDPAQLFGAAILLALATAFAAYLPARRAARLNPMSALREQ